MQKTAATLERPDEPLRTIYGDGWREARQRVHSLAPDVRSLLLSALEHVETGWAYMRELQRWYDDNRERAQGRHDDYAHLLDFIDGDLVDLFREIAAGVAGLVPGYTAWEASADPGTVDGDIETFRRYFALFILAVEQAQGAEALREVARAAATGLAGWCIELEAFIGAIDAAVLHD